MVSTTGDAGRDRSVDALRVIGAAAGLVMHAAVPYTTTPIAELVWSVRDEATTPIADLIFWWGRAAQVPLFLLISGAIAVSVYGGRGASTVLQARLTRLGVPLLAAVAFVLPVLGAIWAAGWMMSGRATWTEVWTWRFADPELQRNRVGPAHLWFLQDLLVIAVVSAAGCHRRVRPLVARAGGSRWVLPALMAIGTALVWWRPALLFSVPNSFAPDPLRIAYGATFYAGGAWLAARHSRVAGGMPAAILVALGGAAAFAVTSQIDEIGAGRSLIPVTLAVASGWMSVLGCVGLASRVTQTSRGSWTRLAGDAYAFYIVHVPVVGALHLLAYRRLPALAGMAIAIVGGAIVTWIIVACGRRLLAAAETAPIPAWLSASGAAVAAMTLGIGLRVLHYARNPDVWHDEAALLVNVIERDYAALLGALTYDEAAPPLFLWLERWIALTISDSTWALRFVPLVASMAALGLLWPLARGARMGAVPVALLLMATSSQLLGHSVEAKPYAIDVFVSTLAAVFVVSTSRWTLIARAAVALAVAPLIIWISYPGIFVMGGVIVALAILNLREKHPAGWLLIGGLGIVCLASVMPLVAGPVRAQRSAAILDDWAWAFPMALDPWSLVTWFVRACVGVADYCFRPFGGLLLVPIAIGAWTLWRRGDQALVALLLVPIGLAAGAGMAGHYPFSGSRVMIYALPALAILAAGGLARIAASAASLPRVVPATALALAVLPPSVLAARDLWSPWVRPETAAAAEIALSKRQPDEIVASGNWESRYYLRALGRHFVALDEQPMPVGHRRIWCIVHGPSPEVRQERISAVTQGAYRIVSTVDLSGVSVIELRGLP